MVSENDSSPGLAAIFFGLALGWLLLAAAFAITAWLIDGVDITGGFWSYVWVSAIFGFVNVVIGTILRILTLPLKLITLGLFSVIVNAVLLSITDALSDSLTIDEFWWDAILAAIVLAVLSVLLEFVVSLFLRPRPRASY
jgi:putative membrane protein